MKIIVLFFIIISIALSIPLFLSQGETTGCPGKNNINMTIQYSFNPQITGLEFEVGYNCLGDYYFGIINKKNDDILIYIDGNGSEHEVFPDEATEKVAGYNESFELCNGGPGGGICIHYVKCISTNSTILENYRCSDNKVCCQLSHRQADTPPYLLIPPPSSIYRDLEISKEMDAEWTRELYFKNSPNKKFILTAKNIPFKPSYKPKESYRNYLFFLSFFVIIGFIIFLNKKFKLF